MEVLPKEACLKTPMAKHNQIRRTVVRFEYFARTWHRLNDLALFPQLNENYIFNDENYLIYTIHSKQTKTTQSWRGKLKYWTSRRTPQGWKS
jgi:hypothetical protein